LEIDFSGLDIIWNLRLEIWNFSAVSLKEDRFFMIQLELA